MNCDTCAKWRLADQPHWPATQQLNLCGVAMCQDGPFWALTRPSQTCVNHEPAEQPVIQQRIQWFAQARASQGAHA